MGKDMRAIFTLMLTFVIMGAMAQKRSHVPLADPFIYYENGVYYAYGTHSLEGFEVYTSKNLKEWNYSGLALTIPIQTIVFLLLKYIKWPTVAI